MELQHKYREHRKIFNLCLIVFYLLIIIFNLYLIKIILFVFEIKKKISENKIRKFLVSFSIRVFLRATLYNHFYNQRQAEIGKKS